MTLLNHIGVFVILIITGNFVEFFNGGWKETEWYIPSGAGIAVFLFFELFYWTITIFFL